MSTRSDTPEMGTGSIDAAEAAFGLLLDREAAPEDRRPQPEAEDDEDDASSDDDADTSDGDDADDADTDDDASSDDEDADEDGEGEDDDADPDDEGADEASLDLNREVPVKIDGKEVKVKLSEALQGYQRQADYSRKTAEVAELRKQTEAQLSAVNVERAQYSQLLGALQSQLEGADEKVDWDALKESDPVEFAVKRFEFEDRQKKLEAIRSEQARLEATEAAEQQAAFNEFVKAERVKMHEAIPAWKDEKVWARDRAALVEYGKSIGFSEEELGQAADSRAVLSLYKAMKFDRLMAKQAKGKPATPAVPTPKPLKVGSANKPPARVTAKNDAMKRLSRSGSVEDAAAAFMAMGH